MRQVGSHLRLIQLDNPAAKITIPLHSPLPVGTLSSILNEVAEQQSLMKAEVIELLFG
jgi:predicted RNA binding protein YcfA (HicA-like mRNA interferase family)